MYSVWGWVRILTGQAQSIPSPGMDPSSCPAMDFYFWAMLQAYKSKPARQGGVLDRLCFQVRRWIAAGRGSQCVAFLQAGRAKVWLQAVLDF